MALKIQRQDKHGNVVAQEGITLCTCGSKYWENDKCIDCGMTPERLWIIQHAQSAKVGQQMLLNLWLTTMLHYRLPWCNATVSEELEIQNITARTKATFPEFGLVWAAPSDCTECGGSDNDHYLSCSVWDFNN